MAGGGWWALGVGLTVFAWATYFDQKHGATTRLAHWFVRRSSRSNLGIGPMAFLVSLGVLISYIAIMAASLYVGHVADDPRWSLVIAYPAMVAYAPFVLTTMPHEIVGYLWRHDLARAGADPALQRRIAWCAGPPSVVGAAAIATTCLAIFMS